MPSATTASKTSKAKAERLRLLTEMLAGITDPYRVQGIDFSITRPGFAVVYGPGQLHTEHMTTAPTANVWGNGHGERLHAIASQACALAKGSTAQADLIVAEAAFGGPAGNDDGLKLAGHFEGLLVAYGITSPVVTVVGSQLKLYATGNGKADKAEMALAARDRLGWTGTVHDEADALWAAAFGWAILGRPIVDLPKAHTVAVDRFLGRPVPKAPARKRTAA